MTYFSFLSLGNCQVSSHVRLPIQGAEAWYSVLEQDTISEMNLTSEQLKRERVLLAVYEMTGGRVQTTVDMKQLAKNIGMDYNTTVSDIGRYLKDEGYITWMTFAWISMTHKGRKEAERLMNLSQSEKERRMLEILYDLSGPTHMNVVPFEKMELELGARFGGLSRILMDLEERGWVEGPDWGVQLTPAGVREVENPGGDRTVGVKYETHFHAPFQGGYIQGPGGIQHIVIKNEFDDAIYKLLQGVENSTDLSPVQKMTLAGDIRTVQQLGQMERTPEVIEAANSKIEFVNGVLSSTADMVSLGMVVIPIIRAWFGI